jgi:hypothetical protein
VGRRGSILVFVNNGGVTNGTLPPLNLSYQSNPHGISGISNTTEFNFPRFVDSDDDHNAELFVHNGSGNQYLFFENNCPCPSAINPFQCAQNVLNIANVPIPPGLYHAIENLNSNGTVNAGTEVDFRAGVGILLQSNFTVVLGATFSARIESCTSPFAPGEEPPLLAKVLPGEPGSLPSIQLHYSLEEASEVVLELTNMDGNHLTTLKTREMKQAGYYEVMIENVDLPSGQYLVVVKTEHGVTLTEIEITR